MSELMLKSQIFYELLRLSFINDDKRAKELAFVAIDILKW